MKAGTGIATGRSALGAPKTVAVLRYLPRHRRPYLPHSFSMVNMNESDATKFWNAGRLSNSPNGNWSPYTTQKTLKKYDDSVNVIPTSDLERFMPNIAIGKAAFVTPVTIMSARDGQRVTHDLIHSYDPHLARNKPGPKSAVDHENITVHDPNRVGLHGDTMGCRSQIYRWLRRSPMYNESAYFFQTALRDGRVIVESEAEKPLIRKIIRLAKTGQLKLACEEYRRLTFIPPVEVYRALLAACEPQGLIADAVSLFTEGDALKNITRDYECFRSLLRTAIAADNVERIMWVFGLIVGTFTENVLKRTAVEPLQAAQLHGLALEYLLDNGMQIESRTVYTRMKEAGLLEADLYMHVGMEIRAEMEKGDVVNLPESLDACQPHADAVRAAKIVAKTWVSRLRPHELLAFGDVAPQHTFDSMQDAFADIDVSFVLRHARFEGTVDLLSTNQLDKYTDRVLAWAELLSDFSSERVSKPLPYILKTKPSTTGVAQLRLAADPRSAAPYFSGSAHGKVLPSEAGYHFWYTPGATRVVEETYPTLTNDSAVRRSLVREAVQREVPLAVANLEATAPDTKRGVESIGQLHKSVSSSSATGGVTVPTPTGTGAVPVPGANPNAGLTDAGMGFN